MLLAVTVIKLLVLNGRWSAAGTKNGDAEGGAILVNHSTSHRCWPERVVEKHLHSRVDRKEIEVIYRMGASGTAKMDTASTKQREM